ncbi:putative NUDIX-family hydrolase [Escherichia coli]|uniref:Putative NUDIX-family hydrolase n=1 Tax=Escherichia coli TaxID=562 RepID=A0A2X1MVV1_ECOLX|nr:putative NUDIX-family hydrolase [Escherichia coli]
MEPTCGHLEADETLVEAAARELWEETGISAQPQHFIRMHQWIAPDKRRFCVSSLPLSLSKYARPSLMTANRLLPLGQRRRNFTGVKSSFAAGGGKYSLLSSGQRYPLEMIGDFNWPFTKGVI